MFAQEASANYTSLGIYDWLKKPSAELLQMASRYADDDRLIDSAMVCFSIIADRYSESLTNEEKDITVRALNEMGVLNTVYYQDHTAAYRNLILAWDICQKIGLSEMEPYILLNIGNLYNLYEFLFPTDEEPRAGYYYEKSFRSAAESHQWDMALDSYINYCMLQMPYSAGEESVHQEMGHALSDSIPRTMAEWEFTSHFHDGSVALLKGDYEKARSEYWQMAATLDAGTANIRDQYMVLTCLSAIFLQQQQYDSLIVYANRILQLDGIDEHPDIQMETYRFLSEYYEQIGQQAETDRYRIAYMEQKEELMKSIVGLVPTQLQHDLQEVSTEIGKMKEQKREQQLLLTAAAVVIVLLIAFAAFTRRKNRQLNEKNAALYRQTKEIIRMEKPLADAPKYKESQLKKEKKQLLVEQIRQTMSNADAICQPAFTLQSLAERLDSNTSYLSQTINENFGMTFTNLLNQYRVREACRRMEDQERYGHLTIDAISESVGFRARVTFTKAFKQHVGMLPSEYAKNVKTRQDATITSVE